MPHLVESLLKAKAKAKVFSITVKEIFFIVALNG
jgi:hypothetical protein